MLAETAESTYVVAVVGEDVIFVYGPPVTVERYTLYPLTVEVLAVQVRVTECETGCTPVPVSVIVAGELVALLVTVTLPGSDPALAGVKVTFNVAVAPAATIWPEETPLAV